MHMQGTPETMQQNPSYDFAPIDIYDWLEERIEALEQLVCHGLISRLTLALGLAKHLTHNLELIQWTSLISWAWCSYSHRCFTEIEYYEIIKE